jgi:acyl-coenzyme A thioesterase PaaI-like protein
MDDDGRVRCTLRAEQKHLNGLRNIHGGKLRPQAAVESNG